MSAKNKKSVAAEALMEMDSIKATLKEESKSTIANLLQEAVKDYMRDSIDGDDDDMEIKDSEKETTDDGVESGESSSESESEFPTGDDFEDVPEDKPQDGEEGSEDAEVPAEGDGEGDEADADAEDGEGDEWSEFDEFKVDDNTYDLTGVKDYDKVVKVYKLLKDDENVVVKKDGDKITLKDGENDAEYVIDLGAEDGDEEPVADESDSLNEGDANNIAGIPQTYNENKKNRKTMKENKEKVFEVDLGYTDNYQKEDPMDSNLSMKEPGKGRDWDKGLPKGTEKPWVGDKVKSAGDPYGEGEAVNEGEEPLEDITEPTDQKECNMEEAAMSTSRQADTKETKSNKSSNAQLPQVSKNVSVAGTYTDVKLAESILAKSEAILKENKELKSTLSKVKSALQEALMVNVNLGKVTKLFLENSTTHKEKVDIINRFNEAKTIDQSNALYESIQRELKSAKQNVMLESKSLNAGGSEQINENKIYESNDLLNIKDFMKRMDNC